MIIKNQTSAHETHATQPRFVYKHRYEVGDLVLIDCLATMHTATPMDVAESPDAPNARLLWRLSTEGRPGALNRRSGASALAG